MPWGPRNKSHSKLQAHRSVTQDLEPPQSTQYRCTACNSLLRILFSCFLPTFCMPESTNCFQFNRGTNTTLSQYSVGKKILSFSSVQEQMILGGLWKTRFCFDLSIATGLFPCWWNTTVQDGNAFFPCTGICISKCICQQQWWTLP